MDPGIPAVSATISGRDSASPMSAARNAPVYDEPAAPTGTPVSRIEGADVVQALLVVGLGREIALALARDHVHDDGTVARRRVAQRGLERGDVVSVDRADVGETESLEERGRIRTLDRAVRRETVGA